MGGRSWAEAHPARRAEGPSRPIPTHTKGGEEADRGWTVGVKQREEGVRGGLKRSAEVSERFCEHRRSCCWGDGGLGSRLSVCHPAVPLAIILIRPRTG